MQTWLCVLILTALSAVQCVMAADAPAAAKLTPEKSVTFSGRVIEYDGGKPIAGATVVVVRTLSGLTIPNPPPWVGKSVVKTDADGRFQLTFPPEQVADPRLAIEIARVAHPDFVPRKGNRPGPNAPRLEVLRHQVDLGDQPFFHTITLERGMDYSGAVVTPTGTPAPDIPFEFYTWNRSHQVPYFVDDAGGRTDAKGRFRLRMPKSHGVMVTLTPDTYAVQRHYWGAEQPQAESNIFAPADLGTITLKPGRALAGRVLDRNDRPIASQMIIAWGPFGTYRMATTNYDGGFQLEHLRPGNYSLYGEPLWYRNPAVARTAQQHSAQVIEPLLVYMPESGEVPPVVLHELETIKVEVRCADSRGKPAPDLPVIVRGTIAPPKDQRIRPPAAIVAARKPREGLSKTIDDIEPENPNRPLGWGAVDVPDEQGRMTLHVPKGLLNVFVTPWSGDEMHAFQAAVDTEKSGISDAYVEFGTLSEKPGRITITRYRSPVVLLTVSTDDGTVPFDEPYCQGFDRNDSGVNYLYSTRQADGRYRSTLLMPGVEHTFGAWAQGWTANTTRRLVLAEGERAEIRLTIRPNPDPLRLGDYAPPVLVKTLDGKVIGLSDFQGKWVLLHFNGLEIGELPTLKAIYDRFGNDPRFAMLALSRYESHAALAKLAREKAIPWPLALLRDAWIDPIAIAYRPNGANARSFLIGPDGKLLAVDLPPDKLMKAVAEQLGAKEPPP